MGAKGIGATLSLKAEKFFENIKKAESACGGLKQKLTGTTSAVKKHESSLGSLTKKVIGLAGAYVSVRGITSFAKDCVNAANVQSAAEKRLETTMLNVKGTTMENVSAVKKYAAELQKSTTVGDEATIQGASQLATFKLQAGTIKTLLPTLQNLAVSQYGVTVSGDQMQGMANLMGKVMTGNVGALTRYGVTLDDNQKKLLKTGSESKKAAILVNVLKQNYGDLAAAMANTPEGRIQQLKNAWGDVQEEIGTRLYPVLTDMLGWLAGKIPTIQEKITSAVDKVSPYVQRAADVMKKGFETAGNVVKWCADNWGWLEPVIGGAVGAVMAYKGAIMVLTAAQWALNFAQTASPINWWVVCITAAAAVIIGVGILVYKNWDKIKEIAGKLWGAVKSAFSSMGDAVAAFWNTVKGAFGGIKNTVVGGWNTVKEKTASVWGGVKSTVNSAMDNIKNYAGGKLGAVKNAFEEHGGGIKGVAFAAMEGVKQHFSLGYDAVNALTGGKLEAVKNLAIEKFNAIKDGVVSVFGKIRDFISGVWDSIKNGARGMVNGIIGAVNKLIGGVNKISFTLPEVMGGTTVGFNIPTIPMLAKGGIVNRSGLAIVGERGPELINLNHGASVTPLPKGGGDVHNNNTFYITITPQSSDDEAINTMVRKIKTALETM